jgi:hypothetical protein
MVQRLSKLLKYEGQEPQMITRLIIHSTELMEVLNLLPIPFMKVYWHT